MAHKPLSSHPKASASYGSVPPKHSGGSGGATKVVVIIAVLALIIGAIVFVNNNNAEQARIAAENKKTLAENEARKAEAAAKAAEAKRAHQEAAEAAKKRRLEEQAKARQEAAEATPADTPDAAAEEPADTGAEEPADDNGDAADDTDNGAADEEEAGDGEAGGEGELSLSPEADKDPANAKRLTAMAKEAAESGEYAALAETLKEKLTAAYPGNMKVEGGKLPTPIRKGNVGESARCLYVSLTLALQESDATPEEHKAFMKWLLTDKRKPAINFVKHLAGFKVTELADAADAMDELRQAFKDDPKKVGSKLKGIANPLSHNVSKKLYPHSKKDITSTINKLKNVKQKGTLDIEQQDAVNLVNVYRYLCGLPPTVVYDKTYHKEATEAAEACKAAGHIAHDLGHFTDKCNLFAGISGPPAQTVSGYMSDNGANNREARGHRAWILFPGTGKTAFGKVGAYQAMRTMDSSGSPKPKTGWSYPGRGYFPVDYLHGTGWSYYFPADIKLPESEAQVKVEMWNVPKGLKSAPSSSRLNKGAAVPILNVYVHLGAYMPTGNTLVFEPDYSKMRKMKDKFSGAYWIRISWPGFKDEFVVEFF